MDEQQPKRLVWTRAIIGVASLSLAMVLAWLMGAFDGRGALGPIPTNEIIADQSSLPQSCRNVMNLMMCLLDRDDFLPGSESLAESYQKLVSERNTMTQKIQLDESCKQHYQHLTNLSVYQDYLDQCI